MIEWHSLFICPILNVQPRVVEIIACNNKEYGDTS